MDWTKILDFFKQLYAKLREAILHALLIGAILIIGALVFRSSFKAVEIQSKPWMEKIASIGAIPDEGVCANIVPQLQIESTKKTKKPKDSKTDQLIKNQKAKCIRLIDLLKYTQNRIALHSELMAYLYTRMYAALLTALAAGLLATLVLVFVTREGWKDANSYLLATFLSLAVVGSFYGMFPGIFDQKKNAEANKDLCIAYDTIAQDINNYLVTGLDETGKKANMDIFISAIGKRLTTLRSLPFDMNPDEVVALTQKVREVVEQQARSGDEGD